jgi:tripartite-type tricarboxylate transporter receptor subunit TctC
MPTSRRLACNGLVGALMGFLCLAASPCLAQPAPADFFKGKTLTVIIPGAPGADRGDNALPFIAHYGKHVPGNPTVVPSFMPGAGGTIGMNYLYNSAPRDGTFIGTPLAAFIIAQVTGDKSAKYDVSKMSWIGRTTDNSQIVYVWHTTGVKDIEGAKNRTITIGSSGVNSASTILPLIMNQVLGTKFKIIQGYNGSAAFNLAVERGETDGALTTWGNIRNNRMDWVKDGKAIIIAQLALARHPDLPNIPTGPEMATDPDGKALLEFACSSADLGQSFVAPPGVPANIIAVLRRAFDETMKDPEYLATTKKANIQLNPLSGAELDKLAARTLAAPKKVIDLYQAAVAQ